MLVIPPYQTAIRLFHKDGSVVVYASLAVAKSKLGLRWIADNVGKHFREYDYTPHYFSGGGGNPPIAGTPVYRESKYIMRNDAGEPVTRADFAVHNPPLPYVSRWSLRHGNWNGEGPVPGVHKHRGGSHFRHIRTTRSRRLAIAIFEEGEVAPRGRQRSWGIPDAWDDFGVAAREDRSWKRYRKTQYKTKRGYA
jgi:hypothetical protein